MADDIELAHEVLRSLRQIVHRVSEYSKHLYKAAGLTVPQLMCLKAIGELQQDDPELTVARVAAQVQLSPATVSRILERLVQGGLVVRERRARDRRKVCLTLSAAGQSRYADLPTPLQEDFVRRFCALDESERVQLVDALHRIAGLMDAEAFDAAPILTPGAMSEGGGSAGGAD